MKRVVAAALAICLCPAILVAQSSVSAADQAALTQGNNAFAVDLYGQLRAQPGNLFFSPESISTAFAMAYAGAHGQTATQMEHVFHYTLPPERLHPAMGALLTGINAAHPHYELHEADALWAEQGATFLPDFLKTMQDDYSAGLHRVDFEHAPEAARGTINAWVAQETNDRIQNLIGPGALTPQSRLVLTNAIYFKGSWVDPFDANDTESGDFYLSAKQTVKTPLMHRTGDYYYYDGGTFQELELPYKGGDLAMLVLLPKQTDGLPALEKQITPAAVKTRIEKLEYADKVILTLPRFTMTQQFELNGALSAMGMPLAFSGSADFSGMTGKPDFTISAAIHKAFIDVNEQGTEAAAATAVMMTATAMPMQEPPPIVFRADHPFLFLIRDLRTGEILFMGRLQDPRS
jgi:serpin B